MKRRSQALVLRRSRSISARARPAPLPRRGSSAIQRACATPTSHLRPQIEARTCSRPGSAARTRGMARCSVRRGGRGGADCCHATRRDAHHGADSCRIAGQHRSVDRGRSAGGSQSAIVFATKNPLVDVVWIVLKRPIMHSVARSFVMFALIALTGASAVVAQTAAGKVEGHVYDAQKRVRLHMRILSSSWSTATSAMSRLHRVLPLGQYSGGPGIHTSDVHRIQAARGCWHPTSSRARRTAGFDFVLEASPVTLTKH